MMAMHLSMLPATDIRLRGSRRSRATIVAVATILLSSLAPMPASATLNSQLSGGHAFLQGTYVEVGVRPNGAFGSSVAAPAGFHPQEGSQLGFVADRDKDGWATGPIDGDFFVPGTPYEGWGMRVAGEQGFNTHSGTGGVSGSLGAIDASGGSQKVTWSGSFGGIDIAKTYAVPDTDQILRMTVTLTNNTGATIDDIWYSRGVDPDNTNSSGDVYDSTNTVIAQPPNGGVAAVSAAFSGGGQFAYFSSDSRARASRSVSGFPSSYDIPGAWTGGGSFLTTVGSSATADAGMNLTVNVGSLAAGASTTFVLDYLLSADAIAAATSGLSIVENRAATSADLRYTFGSNGTAHFVVVPDGSTAPTPAEVVAKADYGSVVLVNSGTDSVVADTAKTFAMTGLTEATRYTVHVVTVYDVAGTPTNSSVTSIDFATTPSAPTVSSVVPGDGSAIVTIAPTGAADNFEWSTNGSTWTPRAPSATSSPWTITGLTNGTAYALRFRSLLDGLASSATTPTSVTPAVPAPAPTSTPGTAEVRAAETAAQELTGVSSVLVRGSVPVPTTTTVSRDAGPSGGMVIADEEGTMTVTVTTTSGATEATGVVAPVSGEVVCEICARLAAGSVVEAWVYSEPRLAAAVRVEVDAEEGTCPFLRIPLGGPLDGGAAIEPGVHTVQLRMYTENGFEVLAFPITVGGPVPSSVPSGEGPLGTSSMALLLLVSLAGAGVLASIGLRTRRTQMDR